MHWLATAKSWQVFLFLISGLWLQLIFEFAEIFSDNVPEMASIAFSMITMGLTLLWIREIGVALKTNNRSPLFSAACWIAAACFLYFAALSILAEDPEIFLQPSYLRPMFFSALALFMGCTIFTAYRVQAAENENSTPAVNVANLSFLLAISLVGVWAIQPKVEGILKK